MAIRTEIFKVSDYDRKHWMHCPLEGVEKYGQDGQDRDGNPAPDEEYAQIATGLVDWSGARGLIARNAPAGINVVA